MSTEYTDFVMDRHPHATFRSDREIDASVMDRLPPALSPVVKLSAAAETFRSLLLRLEGATQRPDPVAAFDLDGVVWTNLVLETAAFRRIHLEEFGLPGRMRVLHVCLFPRVTRNCPIFGFDVVTGQVRPTGAFLDLSPVDPASDFPQALDLLDGAHRAGTAALFGRPRSLPEWGSIFSRQMIAVAPDSDGELDAILAAALHMLIKYLPLVAKAEIASPVTQRKIIKGQIQYCLSQRKNEHTFRMLSRIIGDRSARHFIDETLFPLPDALPNN